MGEPADVVGPDRVAVVTGATSGNRDEAIRRRGAEIVTGGPPQPPFP